MSSWHIISHNILLSADGANTNSLQFNGVWIKFTEDGKSILTQKHQCSFVDTVTADGFQGNIRLGETIRTDGKIIEVSGQLEIKETMTKREPLMSLSPIQGLFPQAVGNFNNLIYNIRSYNKAHFENRKNYYDSRKTYGKKYLDSVFILGTTGPLLGGPLKAASASLKVFSYIGQGMNAYNLFDRGTFSNLYDKWIKKSTGKPVIILDFDKQNDSLRDSTGNVIRAFRQNIISKTNEHITEENIFEAVYHSVFKYVEGYVSRAKGLN